MPDRTESGGVVAFHTGGTVGDGSDVLSPTPGNSSQ